VDLKSKTYETINCIICDRQTKTRRLAHKGLFGWPTYVTACTECGLVYLSPRWTKADYDHFYTKEYEGHFWFDKEAVDEKEQRRIQDVWARLQAHIPGTPKAALDVGCGLGWSLDYLAKQIGGLQIAGLEPSDYCAEHVVNVVGAELVGRDVDSDWHTAQKDRFDIVIMRMVAEHLLYPLDAFKKVRQTLSPGGLFYIAVPNMMQPAGSLKDFWFRIVHTYYYSKTTLMRIAGKAGLAAVVVEEEGPELWGIFRRKDDFADPLSGSVFPQQIRVLRRYKTQRALRAAIRLLAPRKLSRLVPGKVKALIPESWKKRFRKMVYRH